MRKKILAGVLICGICVCVIGCGKNTHAVPDSTTTTEETLVQEETVVSDNPPEKEWTHPTPNVVDIEKYLWEKDVVPVEQSSFTLGDDWMNGIKLDETPINTGAIDISMFPNYFINLQYTPAHLQNEYCKNNFETCALETDLLKFESWSGTLRANCMSYDGNLLVDMIRLDGYINPNENMLITTTYAPGRFGLFSTYNEVVQIIGSPRLETESTSGAYRINTVMYSSGDTEMRLTYVYTGDKKDDAVLTSIEWNPLFVETLVANQYSQEGVAVAN